MLLESSSLNDIDMTSIGNAAGGAGGVSTTSGGNGRPHSKSSDDTQNATVNTNFPPPKTDKPRPHVCATCTRSFARLEHLKRHERSHTKEKPFECPECSRCFARRDLLLRHQQKLHLTSTPTSRQRGRRESASSTTASGSVRVGKKSANNASNVVGSMRPRANTISHVDNATLGMIAAANSSAARHNAMELNLGHIQQQSVNGLPGVGGYHFRGMSTAAGHHGNPHVLPKLDTNNFNVDVGSSLRTAPPYACHAEDSNMDDVWYGQGNTINPAQLHFSHSPQSLNFDSTGSPYHQTFSGMPQAQATIDENGTFTWLNGFENQLSFDSLNEQAMDGSSPSAISTGSRSGLSELMLDGS
ncbi:MAG: hypothetical protein Q9214_007768, partial [Letrouitia sp. 1 TL-2023]